MHETPKGKLCKRCGEPLSNISTQFVRMCTNGDCRAVWKWTLDDGQPPLVSSSRDTRK